MMDVQSERAFDMLGIAPTEDKAAVRRAYHALVKRYHPDRYQAGSEQDAAQKKLIELNLAYELAIRYQSGRAVSMFQTMPLAQAKLLAQRMLQQHDAEGMLRALARSEDKDEEWYYLEGHAMMLLKQYAAAHQSFREAVRRAPDNMDFRRAALEAAVAVKRHRNLGARAAEWAQGLFSKRRVR